MIAHPPFADPSPPPCRAEDLPPQWLRLFPDDAFADASPAEEGPRYTMAELASLEAQRFRGWGTAVGDLFGQVMQDLAGDIRLTGARTPDDFRDRIEILEADHQDRLRAEGASMPWCRCGEDPVL
jgi:hypothetical protein